MRTIYVQVFKFATGYCVIALVLQPSMHDRGSLSHAWTRLEGVLEGPTTPNQCIFTKDRTEIQLYGAHCYAGSTGLFSFIA